ncbi:MAG: MFS transporter [bacterium]
MGRSVRPSRGQYAGFAILSPCLFTIMYSLHHPENRRLALAFEVVNTCSWSAVLGAPLMLVLKSLGASATVLGLAVAMLPLTGALQLGGARLLPHYGYRSLMLRGWMARTVMAGLMAGVILFSPYLGTTCAMWVFLLLLAGFTTLRGVASCAWLPWITQLVPEAQRGHYLAWVGALTQATLIVCGLSYAAIFAALPGPCGFAIVFGWGCLTGFAASWVMSRIPDAPIEAEGDLGCVPWQVMLSYRPFKLLLGCSLLFHIALAALGLLWVPVLRDLYHQKDSLIAMLPVIASSTQLLLLPLLGPLVDRTGSRPFMLVSLLVWVLHAGLWAGLAASLLPMSWPALIAIQVTAGIAGGALGLASQRLLMGTVPAQGRSHFFAMYSVTAALGQGVAPILWGLALDGLATWHLWTLNIHALIYLAAGLLLAAAALACLRLSEPRALGTVEFLRELFVHTPRRALARWLNTSE